jgi:hypothetical protein
VFSNLLWAFISALIGAFLTIVIQEATSYWRGRSGFLAGTWDETLYDKQGNIAKIDRLVLRHHGNIIKGKIRRLQPPDQTFKRWQLYGRIEGNLLFGIFWSTDLKRNPGSYGTMQLHMLNQSSFTGFYVRLDIASNQAGISETMTRLKLEWKRIS